MKVYNYQTKRFFIEQTLTNLFVLVISLVSFFFIVTGTQRPLMVLALIASLYSVVNNFVLKVNSEIVEVGEDAISFEAYGKKDSYAISEVESIQLKEFPSSGKIFVRVTDNSKKQKKYWIHTASFEEGKALFKELLDIEYHKHPERLKAIARSTSTLSSRKSKKLGKGSPSV